MKKLIFILLFILSCENNDKEEVVGDYYLRISFTDFWSGAEEKSYLILRRLNGDIIADTTFVGDSEFIFDYPEDLSEDVSLINLTLIKYAKTQESRDFILESYLHLATGQSLNFRGPGFDRYRSENIKKVSIKNLTNYSKLLISSADDYYSSANLPEFIPINSASSDHLLSVINYPDGTKRYIKTNSNLNTITLDHDHFKTMSSKEFSQLTYLSAISATLYAEIDNNLFRSDELSFGHISQFNFEFFYPKELNVNYKQEIKYYINSQDYLYNETYGSLKQDKLFLESSFDIRSRSPQNFDITLYGEVDQIRSDWHAFRINSENQFSIFTWNVYGPHYLTKYALPRIPSHIKSELNLEENDFAFNGAEIKDDEETKSYQDIIDFKFKRSKAYYKLAKKQRAFRKF